MAIVPKSRYRVRIRKYKGSEPIPDPDPVPPLNLQQYSKSPPPNVDLQGIQADFYRDIPYGEHEKEKFDIFIPRGGSSAKGVLIYFHGGGFNSYSKNEAYSIRNGIDIPWDFPEDIRTFLQNDIAYITVGYPLIDLETETGPRLIEIFERMNYSLQFMKYHSETLKLDKNKFILSGISAGTVYAQFTHFGPDMKKPESMDAIERESTKPFTIATRYGHVTDDVEDWEDKVFPEYGIDFLNYFNSLPPVQKQKRTAQFRILYDIDSIEGMYLPENKHKLLEINSLRFLNSNTEEFWFANFDNDYPFNFNTGPGHHGNHARYLHEVADSVGAPHIIYYGWDEKHGDEDYRDFVIRKINE